jgi:hypothetical protein
MSKILVLLFLFEMLFIVHPIKKSETLVCSFASMVSKTLSERAKYYVSLGLILLILFKFILARLISDNKHPRRHSQGFLKVEMRSVNREI